MKGEFKLCLTFSYSKEGEGEGWKTFVGMKMLKPGQAFIWGNKCFQRSKNTVYVLFQLRSYLKNNLLVKFLKINWI